MSQYKYFAYSIFNSFLKMAAFLVINKIVALQGGPESTSYVGQFQFFLNMMIGFFSIGLTQSLIQYSSKYSVDKESLQYFLGLTLRITLASIFVFLSLGLFFSNSLSHYFFQNDDQKIIVYGLLAAASLALLNYSSSVLQGLRQVKIFTFLNAAITGLPLFLYFAYFKSEGILGIVKSLSLSPLIIFPLFFIILYKDKIYFFKLGQKPLDHDLIRKLLIYGIAITVPAVLLPYAYTEMRLKVLNTQSLVNAGYLQALWRIADAWLLSFTIFLNIYILPELSLAQTAIQVKSLFKKFFLMTLFLNFLGSAIFIVFDKTIIHLMFSEQFTNIAQYLYPLYLFVIIKTITWFFSFLSLTKEKFSYFVLYECLCILGPMLLVKCVDTVSIYFILYSQVGFCSLAGLILYLLSVKKGYL